MSVWLILYTKQHVCDLTGTILAYYMPYTSKPSNYFHIYKNNCWHVYHRYGMIEALRWIRATDHDDRPRCDVTIWVSTNIVVPTQPPWDDVLTLLFIPPFAMVRWQSCLAKCAGMNAAKRITTTTNVRYRYVGSAVNTTSNTTAAVHCCRKYMQNYFLNMENNSCIARKFML